MPTPSLAERVAQAVLPPENTAVLVVDVQNDFAHPLGKGGRAGGDLSTFPATIHAINTLIDAARRVGATVVYLRVEHGLEVDNPPYRARYLQRGFDPADLLCQVGSWGARLLDDLRQPRADEPVFVKHAYDGFLRPELEAFLREREIRTTIVTGVVTDLCVLATATGAFEHGFFVQVPRETTTGVDPTDVSAALHSIERWYGDVPPLDLVLSAWQSRPDLEACRIGRVESTASAADGPTKNPDFVRG